MKILITTLTKDVKWTHIGRLDEVQDVFWASYVPSIYVLGPGKFIVVLILLRWERLFKKKSKISKFSSKNLRISSLAKHLFQPESSIHGSWFCVLYSLFWLSSWYKNFIIIFNPTWSEFFIALKTWWRVEGSGFDSTPSPCCSSADLMLKNGQYIY